MAYGLHFQRADAKQSLKILWHISKKYKRKKIGNYLFSPVKPNA